MTYNIAVVGATGAVGREMLQTLSERNFPINNIHAFEGKLFSDLEAVENGQESSMSAMEIKGRIGDLSQLRNQLYKDLNNILTSTQCNLADSRMNLADQIAMVDIVKKELDNAEKAINELQIIRNNRKR